MIAVMAAMRQEIDALLAAARREGPVRDDVVLGREVLHGHLAGRPVILAQSGVGMVAAASMAALLVQRAESLIMVGTAGGLGPGVGPGDVVVATELLQHAFDPRPLYPRWSVNGVSRFPADPDLTAVLDGAADEVIATHRPDLASLGLPEPRRHTGLVISGDQFVSTRSASDALRADLPDALAVEMEGAAVAQVCHAAGVPFALTRTISDRADDDAHLDFPVFLDAVAAPYARDIVLRALDRLP